MHSIGDIYVGIKGQKEGQKHLLGSLSQDYVWLFSGMFFSSSLKYMSWTGSKRAKKEADESNYFNTERRKNKQKNYIKLREIVINKIYLIESRIGSLLFFKGRIRIRVNPPRSATLLETYPGPDESYEYNVYFILYYRFGQ